MVSKAHALGFHRNGLALVTRNLELPMGNKNAYIVGGKLVANEKGRVEIPPKRSASLKKTKDEIENGNFITISAHDNTVKKDKTGKVVERKTAAGKILTSTNKEQEYEM